MKSTDRKNILLMGDSVIDNASWIPKKNLSTPERFAEVFPECHITNVALDGMTIPFMQRDQLDRVDGDFDEVFVSIGGNDLLQVFGFLDLELGTAINTFNGFELHARNQFVKNYSLLYKSIKDKFENSNFLFCDIYDACWESDIMRGMPKYSRELARACTVAVDLYNASIRKIVDEDEIFSINKIFRDRPDYYANTIEPSTLGSLAIAEEARKVIQPQSIYNTRLMTTNSFKLGLDPKIK